MSTDDLKGWPRWALIALASGAVFVALLAVGAIGTFAGQELRANTIVNHEQAERLIDHEARLRALESSSVRIETKIDRILERLGGP